ncbi:MAG: urea ABC transporter substrate-binding protein [Synechococcaceae cyanobacterium]|nr:urea ABC transporter substrate-binding protein [Synechococcaceae cyanobacterium]
MGAPQGPQANERIKVGILHSRTGTMSLSENTVAEAELLAIAELNRSGGIRLNGRRLLIEPIEEDGASDPSIFAARAARLIDRDRVAVVFGGWTSASRKAMLPVFESRDRMLFYPLQYEGEECSANVLYAGSTPNQQVTPAIQWLRKHRGDEFYLIGSDYVYPHTTNRQIREQLRQLDGRVVGERYLPLGSEEIGPVIAEIRSRLPAGGVIINTLNGDSNVSFFKALSREGLDARHGYSVMSFSVSEEEVAAIGPASMAGSLASWSFFQSLPSAASRQFTARFQEAYGLHRVTNDPAEAAYLMVRLWAAAVERAGSLDTPALRRALIGLRLQAPQGVVEVQPNLHLTKRALIGEVQSDGMFRVVHDAGVITPRPWGNIEATAEHRCDWLRNPSATGSGAPAPRPGSP